MAVNSKTGEFKAIREYEEEKIGQVFNRDGVEVYNNAERAINIDAGKAAVKNSFGWEKYEMTLDLVHFSVHGGFKAPEGGIILKIKDPSAFATEFTVQNIHSKEAILKAQNFGCCANGGKMYEFSSFRYMTREFRNNGIRATVRNLLDDKLHEVVINVPLGYKTSEIFVIIDGGKQLVAVEKVNRGNCDSRSAEIVIIDGGKQLVAVEKVNRGNCDSRSAEIAEGMDMAFVVVFIVSLIHHCRTDDPVL
ncbi:hypothetical protein BJ742DRAFT_851947 [Cladochytrium replicatum]|nr:hypothetical protein BJ742DRAFT_851947 [Cladochytrium replicatum]